MNRQIFAYLKSYSFDPLKIDRLIVSAFLYTNNIRETNSKLLSRYLIKDGNEDYQILLGFLKIQTYLEIEDLIEVFEYVISPKEKIVTGAIYTPKAIRDYIIEQCFSEITDFENVKICDPACGCAGFLLSAAKAIKAKTELTYAEIFAQNIFGLDIKKYSVTRSKLLLTLLAISDGETSTDFNFNFFRGNALNFDWSNNIVDYSGFDIIVGNPPYVCSRNIDEDSLKYIFDWEVSSSGHPDLYIPFFQIGVENLKSDGILGFITMNTFFKSVNGRALRKYFEEKSLALSILDFGSNQVFRSKSTYTCICVIQNKHSDTIEYAIGNTDTLKNDINFNSIYYNNLNHRNGWNLKSVEILNQIENTGKPLGELYQTRNGIATLKNHIYIFYPVQEDNDYYYIENGSVFPIEKGICKEIINPNELTHSDYIDVLRKRAIFPYQHNKNGNVSLINEADLKSLYPKTYEYLDSKKSILATRDKGKGDYEKWYAYGRNQSLERYNIKLFFPHITPHIPNYSISSDENLLFHNGLAVVSDNELELRFLKKIMSSRLFWFYITNSSKPYGSGYFSLSRNYIKNFGIYDFTEDEYSYILNETDTGQINEFLETKYDILLPIN